MGLKARGFRLKRLRDKDQGFRRLGLCEVWGLGFRGLGV